MDKRTASQLICAFSLAGWVSLAGAQPERIVSINVCTDQLLVTLVERARIASLSHLAVDPNTSWIVDQVQGLHLNHGTAEEVIGRDPDLIVAAAFSFRPTVTILKRLGYEVLELQLASSLEEIKENLLALGHAVGEIGRAQELIERFDDELTRLSYREGGEPPLFVSYDANGWTIGDDTLVADVASAAGLEPVGKRLGFSGGRFLSVEQLLLLEPDLLDLGYAWDDPPALASQTLKHPALRELIRRTPMVDIPDPLWACGSLRTLEAVARLRAARSRLSVEHQATP